MGKLIFVLFTFICVSKANYQLTVLYDALNSTGNYTILYETIAPDLAQNNWDNKARSICAVGIWLFYENANYNENGTAPMEYLFGPNYDCINLDLDQRASSVRFAGTPGNYSDDTFTLYSGDYFQGTEEFLVSDKPTLVFSSQRSIIMTGYSNWTVYDQPNFGGSSICLTSELVVAFVTALPDIGIPNGSIRSVRKGCFTQANNIVRIGSSEFKGKNHKGTLKMNFLE